jgi:hypothetical protein
MTIIKQPILKKFNILLNLYMSGAPIINVETFFFIIEALREIRGVPIFFALSYTSDKARSLSIE